MKLHYTRRELAALLGLKGQTLAAWACRGRGPRARKRRGRVLYHALDVESWLADPAGHEDFHHRKRRSASSRD